MSELRHRLKEGEVSSSDEVRWQKCKTETCKTSQNMTPPDTIKTLANNTTHTIVFCYLTSLILFVINFPYRTHFLQFQQKSVIFWKVSVVRRGPEG